MFNLLNSFCNVSYDVVIYFAYQIVLSRNRPCFEREYIEIYNYKTRL